MPKNYPPDTKEWIEQRAYELRITRGLSHQKIADLIKQELDVPQAEKLSAETIRLAVKRMRAAASTDLDALKLQVMGDLYEQAIYIFGEAMTAWQASKEPTRKITEVLTVTPPPARDPSRRGPKPKSGGLPSTTEEVTTEVTEKLPDPRYLGIGLQVMEFLKEVFGVGAGQPGEGSRVQIEVIRKRLNDVRDDAR